MTSANPEAAREVRQSATRANVADASALTGSYLAMNAAATIIAGLGLFQNSAVVILGAMLIAMLYGPLMGVALGLAEGDMRRLGRALVAEIAGAALVLALGLVMGLLGRKLPIGSEILSRTAPSMLDLLVGLFGGIAGGFTYISPGLSGVVVGVAIATSLVPPLVSCGILLAHRLPALASGAFLLFLANFSAISIGAMGVFWLAGHRRSARAPADGVLLSRLISLALLLVLAVHLTVTLRQTVARSILENGVRDTMAREVASVRGARLIDVTLSSSAGGTEALVVVRTPQAFSPAQVARLNDAVDAATGSKIDLHVRSVITEETTRHGYEYDLQPLPSVRSDAK